MGNEEIKKRVENAQRFKEFLRPYPSGIQARFIYAKSPDAYREIDPTLKETADEFFDLRADFFAHANTSLPQEEPEKKEKEHKKEGFDRIHGSEHTDEDLGENPEEPKTEEQPRTRFEQMEKAGKIVSEGNLRDNSWGESEPLGYSAAQTSETSPEPKPITQRLPGLRQIPNKRALRQSVRNPGQEGSSRGSPIRKNKAKRQLRKKMLGAAKKRAVTALLGSFGLPGIVIGLLIFIFVVVFIILMIAMGCYIVNNPIGDLLGVNYCKFEEVADGPLPIPTPTVEPGPGPTKCETNPTDCLNKEFNMIVKSGTEENISDLFQILSELAKSTTYKNLLYTSGPTDVKFSSGTTNCSAHVIGYTTQNTLLEFWNFDASKCSSRSTRKDRILHESGHVIKNGKGRLFQLYVSQAYWPKDYNCYYKDARFQDPWFIKSYKTSFAASIGNFSITGSNESMADSMADYLNPPSSLGNFKSQCPRGYNWVKANIFGNYVY